ncbi:MAG: hypothetical protein EZS28_014374 [Streblomastix strix]|uniref:Uncharacterized protein n=1 Tax=Streblomastix strix TaxID=222440 RepID=A0A5J4W5E8_9EUKA|nr:MAG: hypothetical protein EZS28_014374 [Streblomastix strix]
MRSLNGLKNKQQYGAGIFNAALSDDIQTRIEWQDNDEQLISNGYNHAFNVLIDTLDPVVCTVTYHRAIAERYNMRYNPRSKPFPGAYASLNNRQDELKKMNL